MIFNERAGGVERRRHVLGNLMWQGTRVSAVIEVVAFLPPGPKLKAHVCAVDKVDRRVRLLGAPLARNVLSKRRLLQHQPSKARTSHIAHRGGPNPESTKSQSTTDRLGMLLGPFTAVQHRFTTESTDSRLTRLPLLSSSPYEPIGIGKIEETCLSLRLSIRG